MKDHKILSANQLFLHKEIYSIQALRQTVAAFSSLAEISVEEVREYYHLIFENCRTDEVILRDEFQNYVLLATIQSMGE